MPKPKAKSSKAKSDKVDIPAVESLGELTEFFGEATSAALIVGVGDYAGALGFLASTLGRESYEILELLDDTAEKHDTANRVSGFLEKAWDVQERLKAKAPQALQADIGELWKNCIGAMGALEIRSASMGYQLGLAIGRRIGPLWSSENLKDQHAQRPGPCSLNPERALAMCQAVGSRNARKPEGAK